MKFIKENHQACALTIAGSDSGGNAGIQADIRAFHAFGIHACTVIAALTAQNQFGVRNVAAAAPGIVEDQLDAVLEEYDVGAIKTGMLANAPLIEAVAGSLRRHNYSGKIVVDPVMISTSGAKLLADDAMDAMRDLMLPLASVATPNLPEAEALLGVKISSQNDMSAAARAIKEKFGCAALVKGGHGIIRTEASDVLCDENGSLSWFSLPAIADPLSTHGTGCALSAAMAAALACGAELAEAVRLAKQFTHDSIRTSVRVGPRATVLGSLF